MQGRIQNVALKLRRKSLLRYLRSLKNLSLENRFRHIFHCMPDQSIAKWTSRSISMAVPTSKDSKSSFSQFSLITWDTGHVTCSAWTVKDIDKRKDLDKKNIVSLLLLQYIPASVYGPLDCPRLWSRWLLDQQAVYTFDSRHELVPRNNNLVVQGNRWA